MNHTNRSIALASLLLAFVIFLAGCAAPQLHGNETGSGKGNTTKIIQSVPAAPAQQNQSENNISSAGLAVGVPESAVRWIQERNGIDAGKKLGVRGNVVDENGAPVKNANVDLYYQFELELVVKEVNGKDVPITPPYNSSVRFKIAGKMTDESGRFSFNESEIESGLNAVEGRYRQKPYHFFLVAYKQDYSDAFVFEKRETPKALSSGEWIAANVQIRMLGRPVTFAGAKNFFIRYYEGQEYCANASLRAFNRTYPKIVAVLGMEPKNVTHSLITLAQKGSNCWGTSGNEVVSVCYPWMDNFETNNNSSEMWSSTFPHEFTHATINSYHKPYWAEEGFAEYTARTINNDTGCEGPYSPIPDLRPANPEEYYAASCVFLELEKRKPGFVKGLLQELKDNNDVCNEKSGHFIKSTMSGVYGSDLTDYFISNFGFEKTVLESGNNCS